MSLSQFFGSSILTETKPPPGTHMVLLRLASPVMIIAVFPLIMTGTVSILSLLVQASHGGVAVFFAPSTLPIRRITVVAAHVLNEKNVPAAPEEHPDLFTDYEAQEKQKAAEQAELDKEKRLQQAVLNIKKRMGANAILKGMNLEEGATGKVRNEQIGGHRK